MEDYKWYFIFLSVIAVIFATAAVIDESKCKGSAVPITELKSLKCVNGNIVISDSFAFCKCSNGK